MTFYILLIYLVDNLTTVMFLLKTIETCCAELNGSYTYQVTHVVAGENAVAQFLHKLVIYGRKKHQITVGY